MLAADSIRLHDGLIQIKTSPDPRAGAASWGSYVVIKIEIPIMKRALGRKKDLADIEALGEV